MDLKCKKLDCVYNKEYGCIAKGIKVKHNLTCSTYKKNEELPPGQKQNVSKTLFETAPQYHPFRHNKDINIKCEAKQCLFNENGDCISNGITIQRSNFKAYCSTSIKEK